MAWRPKATPNRARFDVASPQLLQTHDKLGVGSVVKDKGRLIEIQSVDAHPYRGVITPLHGRLR